MKIVFFILLCFSQVIFAQHKKKSAQQVLSSPKFDSSFSADELLNNTLKKSKWNFDLKEFDNARIVLDKDKMKPDVLYFVDAKNFQININQKNCKSIIKGTYQIMKKTEEIAVTFGHRPFIVTSGTNQKCMDRLSFFLEGISMFYLMKKNLLLKLKSMIIRRVFLFQNS